MYSFAEHAGTPHPQDPLEGELLEIEDLCERALANPALLRCSAAARFLVWEEIPRLIALIRGVTHPGEEGESRFCREACSLLAALRQEAEIIRDLVERT